MKIDNMLTKIVCKNMCLLRASHSAQRLATTEKQKYALTASDHRKPWPIESLILRPSLSTAESDAFKRTFLAAHSSAGM